MDYKKHAEHNGRMDTSIHTKLGNNKRISSIYRMYCNQHFEAWGWETFLWDGDKIIEEFDSLDTPEQVVNLHCDIASRIQEG